MKTKTASFWDKALATLPLAVLGAKDQNFPNKQVWDWLTHHFWPTVPVLLMVSAIFAAVEPFSQAVETKLIDKRVQVQRLIFNHFGEMIQEAGKAISQGFDIKDLGLHVWKMNRSFWLPWRKRLKRISVYRLGGGIVVQSFEPGRREGVVGICWDRNRPVELNVGAIEAKAKTDTEFAKLSDAETMGLSWEQFDNFRGRGSIFASPIRKNNTTKFRGCLSLDYRDHHAELSTSQIPVILNNLATTMQSHEFEEM